MDYEVIYSKRRTVSLSVKDGKLLVKAPKRYPKKEIEALIEKHRKWIATHLEYDRQRMEFERTLTDDRVKKLRKEARVYFKEKTEYYSKIMNIKYGRITITGAVTRFGSCSAAGNLSFSYRLMLYPEAAREYVVVHELAHIIELNHSPRFYAQVKKYLPDYKARKKLLEKIPL